MAQTSAKTENDAAREYISQRKIYLKERCPWLAQRIDPRSGVWSLGCKHCFDAGQLNNFGVFANVLRREVQFSPTVTPWHISEHRAPG